MKTSVLLGLYVSSDCNHVIVIFLNDIEHLGSWFSNLWYETQ